MGEEVRTLKSVDTDRHGKRSENNIISSAQKAFLIILTWFLVAFNAPCFAANPFTPHVAVVYTVDIRGTLLPCA